ncbi:MAG: ThuA domain-containing protein [Fimbriimonadaceae bacterium]|nr:ThuA domain-containing protein [Fimbriimonadaceae bacterium]
MLLAALAALALTTLPTQRSWVVYEGNSGPGQGKHVVFLAGDEEYRSEEGLPQLARILAFRHGFKCTVLFSIGPNGTIDPNRHDHQPGMEALDSADLCVMLLRFRQWPDAQLRHFADYLASGKPIVALRTSTHAFDYPADSPSPYRRFGWRSGEWPGGFGRHVLGETWISHWGVHGKQATRGVPVAKDAPLLNGVHDLFCTTDVYEASPPTDAEVLVRGQVVEGMGPDDPPATGRKKTAQGTEQPLNEPMMPVAWTRAPRNGFGKVFTTTMGAATDLLNEDLRRLLVNAAYWGVGLDVPSRADVDLVGPYQPSPFGFDGFRKGVKPADLAWPH